MEYTIGQAAEKIKVAPSTLRYYDKEGLLPSVNRSSGGIRLFKEEDLTWLHLLECLKATGMPLKDIKRYCDLMQQGDASLKERQQMMHERREAVQAQMKEMQRTLDLINYKCWYYDTAVQAGSEAAAQKLAESHRPESLQHQK